LTKFSRRDLLTLLVVAGCSRQRETQVSLPAGGTLHPAIEQALDIILPDGEFPGHAATGVAAKLLEHFGKPSSLQVFLAEFVRTLDNLAEARGEAHFVALSERAKVAVIADAEQQRIPGYLFLRNEAMQMHYSSPTAWPPLGFDHPPQPLGFLDYASPPRNA
jgi:hypothetical protein